MTALQGICVVAGTRSESLAYAQAKQVVRGINRHFIVCPDGKAVLELILVGSLKAEKPLRAQAVININVRIAAPVF